MVALSVQSKDHLILDIFVPLFYKKKKDYMT